MGHRKARVIGDIFQREGPHLNPTTWQARCGGHGGCSATAPQTLIARLSCSKNPGPCFLHGRVKSPYLPLVLTEPVVSLIKPDTGTSSRGTTSHTTSRLIAAISSNQPQQSHDRSPQSTVCFWARGRESRPTFIWATRPVWLRYIL